MSSGDCSPMSRVRRVDWVYRLAEFDWANEMTTARPNVEVDGHFVVELNRSFERDRQDLISDVWFPGPSARHRKHVYVSVSTVWNLGCRRRATVGWSPARQTQGKPSSEEHLPQYKRNHLYSMIASEAWRHRRAPGSRRWIPCTSVWHIQGVENWNRNRVSSVVNVVWCSCIVWREENGSPKPEHQIWTETEKSSNAL